MLSPLEVSLVYYTCITVSGRRNSDTTTASKQHEDSQKGDFKTNHLLGVQVTRSANGKF